MPSLRILIADDNPQYCAALEDYFKKSGIFEVMPFVSNGAALLTCVTGDSPPDVIILDMIMPQLDGLSALRTMMEMGLTEKIKVFANSTIINENLVMLAQKLGAVFFLSKPMEPQLMLERILSIVGQDTSSKSDSSVLIRPKVARDAAAEQMTTNYIRMLCVPAHSSGYLYLKTAICYCVEHYGTIISITTVVYPYVASVHNATPGRVERNIRYAIEYAWEHGNINAQHKIFGYTVNDKMGRPTNKEFVALITDRVVYQLKYR